MIQRIQSIWLLLASLLAFLTIKFPFYSGNIIDATTKLKAFQNLSAASTMLLIVLTVAVAVASLVTIFLYKDRKRQILIAGITAALSVINILIYYIQVKLYVEGNYAVTALLTVLIPIFLLLAVRSIWKDEQLVKSADRLR